MLPKCVLLLFFVKITTTPYCHSHVFVLAKFSKNLLNTKFRANFLSDLLSHYNKFFTRCFFFSINRRLNSARSEFWSAFTTTFLYMKLTSDSNKLTSNRSSRVSFYMPNKSLFTKLMVYKTHYSSSLAHLTSQL